jgi:hypothetical protein
MARPKIIPVCGLPKPHENCVRYSSRCLHVCKDHDESWDWEKEPTDDELDEMYVQYMEGGNVQRDLNVNMDEVEGVKS